MNKQHTIYILCKIRQMGLVRCFTLKLSNGVVVESESMFCGLN